MDYISAPRVPQMKTSVKVGDVIEIKRVITVVEIDNEKKQIKMKWIDKLGKEKVQWITYKMFLML